VWASLLVPVPMTLYVFHSIKSGWGGGVGVLLDSSTGGVPGILKSQTIKLSMVLRSSFSASQMWSSLSVHQTKMVLSSKVCHLCMV